jgi:hypothetical protein
MPLEPASPDFPRDRWHQPLVVPRRGGPRETYGRPSSFGDALDDKSGLHRWNLRTTVLGMSRRADLVLAAAAADPRDKATLDEIVARATEPASAAATTGTALHALTERLDRGEELGPIPDPYGADIAAYAEATKGIRWTAVEQRRVLDGWRLAGTADRIGWHESRLRVGDIKTGKSVDYPHKFAIQLAIYAHSLPYDTATDRRGPADRGLDLKRGLIIHLPAGQGTCRLYKIDIEKGWEAAQLACQVRQWRSTKGLLTPVGSADGATDFTEAARTAPDLDTLRAVWWQAKYANGLTPDVLEAIEDRRPQLSAASTTALKGR